MKKEYLAQCSPILREFLGYMEVVKGRSAGTSILSIYAPFSAITSE